MIGRCTPLHLGRGTLQDSVVSKVRKEMFSAGFPASGGRFESHYQVDRIPMFRLNGVV
jgi:hypothetical protein